MWTLLLLGFLKARTSVSYLEACPSGWPGTDEEVLAALSLDGPGSVLNIGLQSCTPTLMTFPGEGEEEEQGEGRQEEGRSLLHGRQQAQVLAAADGRLQQSPPQSPGPHEGKGEGGEAGQAPLEPQPPAAAAAVSVSLACASAPPSKY